MMLRRAAWMAAILFTCMGCDTLQFYGQAVRGQWQLLQARVPLAEVIAAEDTSAVTRQRLTVAENILAFAATDLDMPAQQRYSSYVALSRDYVVWNVFAAPAHTLDAKQWCYPIVGCAPYRGYFAQADAERIAAKYQKAGLETYVGGVPAYSTLGYFDDPLLSTFIHWPDPDLANLLIHELAHSKVWLTGEVAFNESFAEFVGLAGTRAWLETRGTPEAWRQWLDQRRQWRAFREFALSAREYLQEIYASDDVNSQKPVALAQLQACYQSHRASLGQGRYDEIMREHFNNAFLVSISTYADYLPAFRQLHAELNGDWPSFFTAVQEIADLEDNMRIERLEALAARHSLNDANTSESLKVSCTDFMPVAAAPKIPAPGT